MEGEAATDRSAARQLSVLDELETIFGSVKTKQDVLKALASCQILHRIPLMPPNVPIEQAHKDFCRERVLLNDVAFIPDKNDTDRAHAFALTLKTLLQRLMLNKEVYDESKYRSADDVSDILMQRACRTSAGADSFFFVQKMLCTEGTFVVQKTFADDPPIHIDVFEALQCDPSPRDSSHGSLQTQSHARVSAATSTTDSDSELKHDGSGAGGNSSSGSGGGGAGGADHHFDGIATRRKSLCARIQVSNSFAVFDVSSLDELTGVESQDPKPWLDIDSVVVDESNFREGKHWRRLHLIITCPETGVTYSSSDDVIDDNRASGRLSSRKIFNELTSWFSPQHMNRATSSPLRTASSATPPSSASIGGGDNGTTDGSTPRSSLRLW